MKQLILTFFAVILCYSLLFDSKPKVQHAVDEVNYIYEETSVPNDYFIFPDTLNFYAFHVNDISTDIFVNGNYFQQNKKLQTSLFSKK